MRPVLIEFRNGDVILTRGQVRYFCFSILLLKKDWGWERHQDVVRVTQDKTYSCLCGGGLCFNSRA